MREIHALPWSRNIWVIRSKVGVQYRLISPRFLKSLELYIMLCQSKKAKMHGLILFGAMSGHAGRFDQALDLFFASNFRALFLGGTLMMKFV